MILGGHGRALNFRHDTVTHIGADMVRLMAESIVPWDIPFKRLAHNTCHEGKEEHDEEDRAAIDKAKGPEHPLDYDKEDHVDEEQGPRKDVHEEEESMRPVMEEGHMCIEPNTKDDKAKECNRDKCRRADEDEEHSKAQHEVETRTHRDVTLGNLV